MNLLTKGKEGKFTIQFAETQPSQPPNFSIRTPGNLVFISGVGQYNPDLGDSMYEMSTIIPAKAPSSTCDKPWSITWSKNGTSKTMYFEVQDPDLTIDELYIKELTKLSFAGRPYTGRMVVPEQVHECTLEILSMGKALGSAMPCTIEGHRLGTQITSNVTSSIMAPGELDFVWRSDVQDYYQRILIAPLRMLGSLNKVRFMIDRVLKGIEEPQAYTESDIFAAIVGGVEYINMVHPVTSYNVNTLPQALIPFLHYSSCIYMLNSQYMLEADLAFSYSGQSVSLDYDRTGAIEATIGKYQDYLNESLPKAKKMRANHGYLGLSGNVGQLSIKRNQRVIVNN